MTLNEFKEKLFQSAREAGFTDFEVYYVSSDDLNVGVFEKQIENYSVSSTLGLSFRGIYGDKMGYAYTEVLDDEAVALLVKNAKDNATIIENEDVEFIHGEKETYAAFDDFNEEAAKVTPEQKIKLALQLEEEAFKVDKRVIRVEAEAGSSEITRKIMNSKGLELSYRTNALHGVVSPVVQEGERMDTSYSYKITNKTDAICPETLAKEAVTEALAYTGAQSVVSNKYKVALRNDAAADLLRTFSGIFSAENVQKGMSLLKGKNGQQIASHSVTLIDNPLLAGSMSSAPFDAEGVATYKKEVIQKGTLTTLLYNLKTASKDGVKTTGNASKGSYASPIGIAPFNFYYEPGIKNMEELLMTVGEGLYITDLQGLHSGANPVSGDFSLAAKGFVIKDGKIERPVEQITVAGNFYKFLEDIEEVGSDLKFGFPSGSGCCGSPTLIIKEMSVAGK